ncbi:hypothetical protein [Limosilactobacillus reuteri]|uniref:hypothetical protein n=1 Tax=Limosilactobacillus reuteri TaxID=1598 RepID=UPI001E38277C|nr:hypothetical protein [Limosilactobacillus reuteri]MCC4440072.1 hypothetical protein [Limosilactobacillus reuteri]
MDSIKDAKITNITTVDKNGNEITELHSNGVFSIHAMVDAPINTTFSITFKLSGPNSRESVVGTKSYEVKIPASSQYSKHTNIETDSNWISFGSFSLLGDDNYIKLKAVLENGDYKTTVIKLV